MRPGTIRPAPVQFNRVLTLLCQGAHMPAPPLSFVSVFAALALHLADGAAPLSPQTQRFADATIEYRTAWRAARALGADRDRGYALQHATIRQAQALPCRVKGAHCTGLHDDGATVAMSVAVDRAVLERRLGAQDVRMEAFRPAAMHTAAPCGNGDAANPDPAPDRL